MSKTENFVKVAIIGAGYVFHFRKVCSFIQLDNSVGGITAGISLQNKLKFYDYTVSYS